MSTTFPQEGKSGVQLPPTALREYNSLPQLSHKRGIGSTTPSHSPPTRGELEVQLPPTWVEDFDGLIALRFTFHKNQVER